MPWADDPSVSPPKAPPACLGNADDDLMDMTVMAACSLGSEWLVRMWCASIRNLVLMQVSMSRWLQLTTKHMYWCRSDWSVWWRQHNGTPTRSWSWENNWTGCTIVQRTRWRRCESQERVVSLEIFTSEHDHALIPENDCRYVEFNVATLFL